MIESIDTYLHQLKSFLIIETALVGLFLVAMLAIWYMAIKSSKASKGFLIILVVICIFYVCSQLYPGICDLKNKNIVIAHNAKYDRKLKDRIGKYQNSTYANIKFTIDGVEYGGKIIKGPADAWPRGERNGTIVYAPRSGLILDFIFTDEAEYENESRN